MAPPSDVVAAPSRGLTPVAEGIWVDTGPAHFLGLRLTSNMVVLRLQRGLLVWSPIALTAERRAQVEALGTVEHLYAPNLFHHLSIGDWAAAFPGARLHAPAGMAKKRPDLPIHRVHGAEPEPAFAGLIEELPIEGCRLNETALMYLPGKTLLVADLVHNIGAPEHGWTSLYTRMAGFYNRVGVSRVLRWTSFANRQAARQSIQRVLEQPFERVVLGHGAPLEAGAHDALAAAYSWLLGPLTPGPQGASSRVAQGQAR